MRCIRIRQPILKTLRSLSRESRKNARRCGDCRHFLNGWCSVLAVRRRAEDRRCHYGDKIGLSENVIACRARTKSAAPKRKKGGRK